MKNPYEILGIASNSSTEQVKQAYKELAAKYHPDNYSGGPLAAQAAKKMDEINEAYDNIIMTRGGQSSSSSSYYQNDNSSAQYTNNSNAYQSDFYDIRVKINNGRIDDAEMRLDGISPGNRTAEWYFLKGSINNRRGWLDEAKKNFTVACQMDPTNTEYKDAFNALGNGGHSSGGYRTQQRESRRNSDCFGSDKSVCDICSGLLCADCCCECMGGDLIPCC